MIRAIKLIEILAAIWLSIYIVSLGSDMAWFTYSENPVKNVFRVSAIEYDAVVRPVSALDPESTDDDDEDSDDDDYEAYDPTETSGEDGIGQLIGGTEVRVSEKNFYICGNAAYSFYDYYEPKAITYAEAISNVAECLDGEATVYSIIVPEALGMALLDEYKAVIQPEDMGEAIEKTYAFMSDKVHTVDAYSNLYAHKDEYLYFRTDHHWTQIGAYYAYQAFCAAAGLQATRLSDHESTVYDGFLGSWYTHSDGDPALGATPDYLKLYYPISKNYSFWVTWEDGTTGDAQLIVDVGDYSASNKYSAYTCGDRPLSIITNNEITDGSACLLSKDSFGNPFSIFLMDHYQYTYMIDYRKYTGSILSLVRENNITDVIFLNPVTLAQGDTPDQIKAMTY